MNSALPSCPTAGSTRGTSAPSITPARCANPKTGQDVPDGVMELRLWAAGNTRRARRQSELCYSWLGYLSSPRAAEPLSVAAQVDYLWNCLILSSANDAAWLRLAALAGRADLPGDTQKFLAKVGTDCVGILGGYPDVLYRVQREFLKAEPRQRPPAGGAP